MRTLQHSPPLAFKRPADHASPRLGETVRELPSLLFPSARKQTEEINPLQKRAPLQPECLLLLLGFFESDNSEEYAFKEGTEVMCFDPTRRFDPHQWATLFLSVLFPATPLCTADTVSSRQSRPHHVSTCSPAHLFSMVILCLNAVFLPLQRWGGVSHLYPRLKQSNKDNDW